MTSFPSQMASHAKLLGRMIRACGVDPAQLTHDRPGLTFISIARACMACEQTESCRAWLDLVDGSGVDGSGADGSGADGSGVEREGVQDPPAFCPNAARFRQVRAG